MLFVLVEPYAPSHLLRPRVDLDITPDPSNRLKHLPRDFSDRPVWRQRDERPASVAVLNDRLVGS
jgi:hypothetical protein